MAKRKKKEATIGDVLSKVASLATERDMELAKQLREEEIIAKRVAERKDPACFPKLKDVWPTERASRL